MIPAEITPFLDRVCDAADGGHAPEEALQTAVVALRAAADIPGLHQGKTFSGVSLCAPGCGGCRLYQLADALAAETLDEVVDYP